MSKKVIGALLAIVMVLSVFSFTVFAASTGYDTNPKHTQTWGLANKTTGSDGTYTVDVLLTTTYEVGPIQFKIDGVDEVTKVTVGSGYYAAVANAGKSGLISIIPDTSTLVPVRKLSNAVVATVTYKSTTNGTPSIKDDVKNASNPQGTLMAAYADGNGYLNGSDFLVGQEATIVPLGGEMPDVSVDAADLALKSGVTGVVIDTHKTFGGAYAGVVYGFAFVDNKTYKTSAYITNVLEATNGGSLVITTSDGAAPNGQGEGNYGTGSTIRVKNADGTDSKVYVICIFGDIDGNGVINTNDARSAKQGIKAGVIPENSLKRLAANAKVLDNATKMHNIATNDAQAIKGHVGKNKLNFAEIAAAHASFNEFYQ